MQPDQTGFRESPGCGIAWRKRRQDPAGRPGDASGEYEEADEREGAAEGEGAAERQKFRV